MEGVAFAFTTFVSLWNVPASLREVRKKRVLGLAFRNQNHVPSGWIWKLAAYSKSKDFPNVPNLSGKRSNNEETENSIHFLSLMLNRSHPVIIINKKNSGCQKGIHGIFLYEFYAEVKRLPGYRIILLSSGPGVQNSNKPPEPVLPISGYFIMNKEPSLLWAFKWNRIPYLLKSAFLSTDSSQLTNNPLKNHQGIQRLPSVLQLLPGPLAQPPPHATGLLKGVLPATLQSQLPTCPPDSSLGA